MAHRPFTRQQRQNARFLAALSRTGNVGLVCRELGVHRACYTKRRAKCPAFAARWAEALVAAHARAPGRMTGAAQRLVLATVEESNNLRIAPADAGFASSSSSPACACARSWPAASPSPAGSRRPRHVGDHEPVRLEKPGAPIAARRIDSHQSPPPRPAACSLAEDRMTRHMDRDEHSRPTQEASGPTGRAPSLQAPGQPAPPVRPRARDGLAARRLLLA